ncbi:MAG: C39 family peptidase [Brevefilum sp.]|jgi:tetratricopeptide (TPR) repeat protein
MVKKQWNRRRNRTSKPLKILLILAGLVALMIAVYFLPPVHDRLSWRLYNLRAKIFYFFNPPDADSFSPGQQEEMEKIVQQTQTAMASTATPTLVPTLTPTNYVSPTPTHTASPTPSPTPPPKTVTLEGIRHEYQEFNNCGPATLSMALSFWGWEGTQTDTAANLKPNARDRNVMPYEMVDFVRTQTNLNAIIRWGGDLEMVKMLIAGGFPVLVERGFLEEVPEKMWMGHYNVLGAYNDSNETFLVQDSFGGPNVSYSYERIGRHWRAFNYVYIIIFPYDREAEVMNILGPHADEAYNLQYAAEKMLEETTRVQGLELFFAWYSYGTSLVNLQDYFGAAQAFDQAYKIYDDLTSKPNLYRITWYQTGPYYAYFYTGRYQDVINLANSTLGNSFEPAIEETWVWRGRARLALGDTNGAIEDFRTALEWHPNWWVAEQELRNLGVVP